MPTPTYVALAKTVLTGTQASVTFSGIVNTYTDLLLTVSARGTTGSTGFDLTLNGTSANYSYTYIFATGSGAPSSSRASSQTTTLVFGQNDGSTTSNTFSNVEIYIPNYAGSTNKPISITPVTENNGTTAYIVPEAALWSNTAAITSITLTSGTSFVSGSRFDLYGIKNS